MPISTVTRETPIRCHNRASAAGRENAMCFPKQASSDALAQTGAIDVDHDRSERSACEWESVRPQPNRTESWRPALNGDDPDVPGPQKERLPWSRPGVEQHQCGATA